MDKLTGCFALTLALVVAAPAQAAGTPEAGKVKSAACAACHGADGNSANPEWPTLAGQHQGYIAKQLKDYKSGRRQNAMMSGMAAPLSDQDIEDLAAYFASQNAKGGETDPALLDLGRKIYLGGNANSGVPACTGCHGPAGAGNPSANFPALAGQHAKYTALTLDHFKDAIRANDPNKMMRMIAGKMSKQEIEAVSSYIAGLYQ